MVSCKISFPKKASILANVTTSNMFPPKEALFGGGFNFNEITLDFLSPALRTTFSRNSVQSDLDPHCSQIGTVSRA